MKVCVLTYIEKSTDEGICTNLAIKVPSTDKGICTTN